MLNQGKALLFLLNIQAMFPFVKKRTSGIEHRDMRSAASCSLAALRSVSLAILEKSDSELFEWMKQKYPDVKAEDVRRERNLLMSLISANDDGQIDDALSKLNEFHNMLADIYE